MRSRGDFVQPKRLRNLGLELVDRVKRIGRVIATLKKNVKAVSPKSLWVPWTAARLTLR